MFRYIVPPPKVVIDVLKSLMLVVNIPKMAAMLPNQVRNIIEEPQSKAFMLGAQK